MRRIKFIPQEQDRQKHMFRLMSKYTKLIDTPGTWILPYEWIFYYEQAGELKRESKVLFTNNIVFACMIFEAAKLPAVITIVDATLSGYEEEYRKIIDNEKIYQNV